MANPTFAAIDVGTTKVCTVVAEVAAGEIRILGVGVGPSAGLQKGMVDNIHAAIEAIASSVDRAERASGTRILSAHVGIAGDPHGRFERASTSEQSQQGRSRTGNRRERGQTRGNGTEDVRAEPVPLIGTERQPHQPDIERIADMREVD